VEQFDLLFTGEITEEQAIRHGIFVEHPPMTIDWDALTADEAIVSQSFFLKIIIVLGCFVVFKAVSYMFYARPNYRDLLAGRYNAVIRVVAVTVWDLWIT
jgi:hypothetical protein